MYIINGIKYKFINYFLFDQKEKILSSLNPFSLNNPPTNLVMGPGPHKHIKVSLESPGNALSNISLVTNPPKCFHPSGGYIF